jgi:PAS domain S-box-containing protein
MDSSLTFGTSQLSGAASSAALSAYLAAALDSVVMADASGRIVEFNPAAERTFGYSREEALGRTLADLIVPPSLRERHRRAFRRFVETREPTVFGRRLELTGMRADGSEFPVELVLSQVEGEPLLICGALRDLSEAKQAEGDLRLLADEQAALRRVATLVAQGARPADVFAAVAEEVAKLLQVPLVSVVRYQSDEAAVQVGVWGPESPFPVGTRWSLDGPSVMASVLRSGRPAKIDDYANLPGSLAGAARAIGMRLAVGAPIVVDGRTWGAIIALSAERGSLPADTERRLVDFTEVVATAVSNAQMSDDRRRLADEQAALRRVATLVAREATPTEVFASVAEEVARLLDVPLASILSYEADGTATLVAAWGDNPFSVGDRYPPHPGVVSEVWRTGQPASVEYADLPDSVSGRLWAAGIRSGFGVPIIVDGSTWGVVVVLSTERKQLPEGTDVRLTGFTELVATAIGNAQARDDVRRLAEEQAALRRVATLVAEQAPPTEVFATVAEEVQKTLDLPLIVMARYERDDTIAIIGATGEHPFRTGTRWPLDPGVSSLVLQTGRPAKVEYENLPGTIAEAAREGGFRTGLGVPIVVDGAIWGVIATVSTAEQPLRDDAEARLADFTELVATAISNTQARGDVRRLADEQAALRRVATLVAREATPTEVFASVAKEVAQTLGVPLTAVVCFEADGTATQVGAWGAENPFPVGTTWALDDHSVSGLVSRTGRPARVDDYSEISGDIAATLAREAGIRTAVGVPIVVEGRLWGTMMALSTEQTPLPTGSEARLARFTELVAAAIANTQARGDLRRLADEQVALRRVATLVARGTDAPAVFDAICEETGHLLGASSVNLVQFTPDGSNLTVAGWSLRGVHVPTGTRCPLEGDSLCALIRDTAAPGRSGSTASEQRFRTLVEQLPLVTYVRGLDVQRSNAYVSPQVEALLGYSVEEWERDLGLLERIIYPDDLERVLAAAARLRETGEPLRLEYRYIARDGRVVWVYDETHLVRDADGCPLGVQGILLDISERKLAEAAASASEKRFQAMVAEAPGATVRRAHDVDWTMEFVSDAFEEISGYPASDFVGNRVRSFASVIHPDDKAALAGAIERGKPYEIQYRVVQPDGSQRWVLERGLGESGPNGTLRLHGAIFDITDRRRAQDALAESEQRFHSIVEANEWIWAEDARGRLTYTNPAVYEMLGYRYGGKSGELAARLRRPGVRSEVGAPVMVEGLVWGALLASADDPEPLPLGTERRLARFAELIATAVSNETTRSELIASRARIVAAGDEARRRIERNLHDGTQQRLVSLGLDLQAVQTTVPPEQQDTRSGLERIARGIEAVLDDIRELSRGLHPGLLSRGGLRPALRALAQKSPIPVKLDIDFDQRPPEPIELAAYYVVSEALTNAAKHAKASEVSVTAAASDDHLRIAIRDDGIGGAEPSAGSGLVGLIDRVEALGGGFALDSPPGNGTEISIELPLAAEETIDVGPGPAPRPRAQERRLVPGSDLPEIADAGTLLAAVAAVAEALYIVDPQGRITFLNSAALRILGYVDERQLLGRPSHDTIHYLRADGTPFPATECPLLRPRVSGETVRVEEDWFVRQDGSLVAVSYSSAPVPLPDGRGAVVLFRAISEPRSSEEVPCPRDHERARAGQIE